MKIVVCVKAVPDPKQADKIRIDEKTGTLMRKDIPFVTNPLDRNALEAALQLKNEFDAEVHVVSMGPPPAGNIVKECLALGADHGVLLSDHAFGGADAFATAFTLAKAIQKIGDVDLVICGMASSDGATEWVGPQIAVFLGFAVVTMVNAIDQATGNCWLVQAAWEEGVRKVELSLPAVLTVARELNEPKALSFSGIIKARKKEITVWDSAVLGTDPEQVGMQGSPTIVSSFGTMETGRDVEFLQGTPEEKAEELVSRLAESGALA